jgi:outer membrane protein, heavy metal efflux system
MRVLGLRHRFSLAIHFATLKTLLHITLTAFLVSASYGASETTIDALVAEALARNPELNFYVAATAGARGERRAAAQWAYPDLSTNLGGKHVNDLDGNSIGTGPAWSFSVTERFEYPGRIALRKAIADRQIALAELGLANFRIALTNKVRTAAHRILIAQQKAEAAHEVSARLGDLLSVLEQRPPAGVVPMIDMRVIQASTIVQERRGTEAAREAAVATYELNQLRGVNASAPLMLVPQPRDKDIDLAPIPETSVLLTWAREKNFEFRTRIVELEQHGYKVRLALNERWPSFTIGPYTSGERANDEQLEAGIAFAMPLPFWNANRGNIESAKARKEQARTSLTVTWREIERKIVAAANAYRIQREQLQKRRPEALHELRDATAVADENYRAGALPITTYIELQKEYLDASDALLSAQGDALASRDELELLTGTRLDHASGSTE